MHIFRRGSLHARQSQRSVETPRQKHCRTISSLALLACGTIHHAANAQSQAPVSGPALPDTKTAKGGDGLERRPALPGPTPKRSREKASVGQIEEVVVTARRIRTKLQDTPVADTAFTPRELQLKRIQTLDDVALRTPSTSFIQISQSESYVSIRGTLVDSGGPGYNSAVTTFLDDVPLTGFGDGNPDLYDLAGVEVLRGPQGTLFGRNVTGGALLIHSAPPTFTPLATAEISYGSDNYIQARAAVNGPIIPGLLAGRVAVDSTNRDDNVTNVTLHNDTGGVDVKNVRGQLLYTPNADVRITLGGDYLKDESAANTQQLIGSFRPVLYPTLSFNPLQTNEGFDSALNKDTGGAFLRAEWTMPWAQLTSITGFRHVFSYYPFNQLGDPTNQGGNIVEQRDNQISEEIHIASLPDSPISWLGGLFLLQATDFESDNNYAQINPNVVAVAGGPLGTGGPFANARINYLVSQRVTDRNAGVFGEVTYPITDEFKATVGGRYTYETKDGVSSDVRSSPSNFGDPTLNAIFASIFTPRPAASIGYNHAWDAFTPKFTLSYQPKPNLLVYATIARGFKSGGFDTSGSGISAPPAGEEAAFARPFAPETVWNYEVGEKIALLQRRLEINTSLYFAAYRDLQDQQLVIATGQQQTTNAGGAQSAGVELEALARPLDWLQTGLNYTYNDAHFNSYVLQNGPGQAPSDFSGNRLPIVPRHNLHASIDTNFSLPNLPGSFLIGGDITYKSKVFYRNDNIEPKFIEQHSVTDGLVNAHITWISDSNEWRFSLFGKNITNQFTNEFSEPFTVYYATPQEYANPKNAIWLARYNPQRLIGFTLAHTF